MNASATNQFKGFFYTINLRKGWAFGFIILAALVAFEIFNFSTTEFALNDLLGNLSFAGVSWSTILAIAFCGIDFAGIARLFTSEDRSSYHGEVWYLFGAWLLAATMNALLTWWGVSIAVYEHTSLGSAVLARETLLQVVPVFVAVMVWLIRILIIGSFSVTSESLLNPGDRSNQSLLQKMFRHERSNPIHSNQKSTNRPFTNPAADNNGSKERFHQVPEPIYHPASLTNIQNNKQSSSS
jgi:hypothetical protein